VNGEAPGNNDRQQALVFTSPDQGSIFRLAPHLPTDKQKIRIAVRPEGGLTFQWVGLLVNGEPLAEGAETLWQMVPGTYTFDAVGTDAAGNGVRAKAVTIEVLE
jgi:hypothetical protein